MVGWHHQSDGHEFEQTPGGSEGLGGLACCSPWGHKELDMTEQLTDSTASPWGLESEQPPPLHIVYRLTMCALPTNHLNGHLYNP